MLHGIPAATETESLSSKAGLQFQEVQNDAL